MPFEIASALILVCLAAVLFAVLPGPSRRWAWVGTAGAILAVIGGRMAGDAAMAMDVAAACLLASLVLTCGHRLTAGGALPAGAVTAAVAVVTAAGVYLRAHELAITIEAQEALQPDVRYYLQQASTTVNPFAAGQKSPLWPVLHAPLVRTIEDANVTMRVWSWAFGMAMIPVVAIALGRLFEPVVGMVVAGTLAIDPFLVDLCTKGLREECGVCLWMVVLLLLFAPRRIAGRASGPGAGGTRRGESAAAPGSGHPDARVTASRSARRFFSWRRVLASGCVAGILLLLRNTDLPVLMLLMGYALVRTRTPWPRVVAGMLLPLVVVTPFYVNQWRVYGDAFYLEKRDARYHANFEFMGRAPPPGLSLPAGEEFARDLFAGEPLSPADYLFKYHTPAQIARYQWDGLRQVSLGEKFSAGMSWWLRLVCLAGILTTLLSARHRFAALFFLGSVLGIRAHLIAAGWFEERLLLPVFVVWLASGWWLAAAVVRAGLNRWLAFPRQMDTNHLQT